ncbi:MAG: hypothetical protein R6W75_03735 [Smithellaceae bacterium]
MLEEKVFVKPRILVVLLSVFLLLPTSLSGCEPTHPQKKTEGKVSTLQAKSPTLQDTAKSGVSMRALWTVSGFFIPTDSDATQEQARTLLFKPLDIGESWITFDGKTCHNLTFTHETVNPQDVAKSYFGAIPEASGNTDIALNIVKTDCDIHGFSEYLRLKDRRLVIKRDGVFFYFQPAVDY